MHHILIGICSSSANKTVIFRLHTYYTYMSMAGFPISHFRTIIIQFYERNELIVLWEIGKLHNQNIRGVLRRTQTTFMMLYFQFPYILVGITHGNSYINLVHTEILPLPDDNAQWLQSLSKGNRY